MNKEYLIRKEKELGSVSSLVVWTKVQIPTAIITPIEKVEGLL